MKPVSDFLQQLIDDANQAIEQSQISIKEKLLYVYNQAIEEGYTPKTARKLMQDKIPLVSDRYIREVLPQEAKQIQDHSRQNQLKSIPAEQFRLSEKESNVIDVEAEQRQEEEEEQEPLAPYTNTDDILKLQNELEITKQLLGEARQKVEELDGLTSEQAFRMQELSRQLTEETTRIVEPEHPINFDEGQEIEKPASETHWNQFVDAECQFCHKITPFVIRHFISGKIVQWVDRDRYKELYGMVPAE